MHFKHKRDATEFEIARNFSSLRSHSFGHGVAPQRFTERELEAGFYEALDVCVSCPRVIDR